MGKGNDINFDRNRHKNLFVLRFHLSLFLNLLVSRSMSVFSVFLFICSSVVLLKSICWCQFFCFYISLYRMFVLNLICTISFLSFSVHLSIRPYNFFFCLLFRHFASLFKGKISMKLASLVHLIENCRQSSKVCLIKSALFLLPMLDFLSERWKWFRPVNFCH